jgi:hypothetical protein
MIAMLLALILANPSALSCTLIPAARELRIGDVIEYPAKD